MIIRSPELGEQTSSLVSSSQKSVNFQTNKPRLKRKLRRNSSPSTAAGCGPPRAAGGHRPGILPAPRRSKTLTHTVLSNDKSVLVEEYHSVQILSPLCCEVRRLTEEELLPGVTTLQTLNTMTSTDLPNVGPIRCLPADGNRRNAEWVCSLRINS